MHIEEITACQRECIIEVASQLGISYRVGTYTRPARVYARLSLRTVHQSSMTSSIKFRAPSYQADCHRFFFYSVPLCAG